MTTQTIRCGHTLWGYSAEELAANIVTHKCSRMTILNRLFAQMWSRIIPRVLDAGADDYHLGKISLFFWYIFLTKKVAVKDFPDVMKLNLRETMKRIQEYAFLGNPDAN
jgi:hypothetical protein